MSDGTVEISLDKVRHLRFDMNAIADIENETGWDLNKLSTLLQKPPSVTLMRVCLWAGLRDEDDSLTIRQVGRWLTPGNLASVWPKVIEAFNLSLSGDKQTSPFSDSAIPS